MENTVLHIKNVHYTFHINKPVLTNVSLEMHKGDILFLLGPNGAGKTTLIKCILGLLTPSEGWISIQGRDMNVKNRLALLRQIGVLMEHASFYKHLTVRENAKIFAGYYDAPTAQIDEVFEVVGLSAVQHQKGGQLSAGLQQRLSLALALIHHPVLVILDEPTNNLDPQAVVEFRKLVLKLNRDMGVSFFITSHILGEVEKIATHVSVLRSGKLLDQRPISAVGPLGLEQYYLNLMTTHDESPVPGNL